MTLVGCSNTTKPAEETKTETKAEETKAGESKAEETKAEETTAKSAEVSKARGNIVEVTQSVLQDFFAMIMLIDITEMNISIDQLRENLKKNVKGMDIHVMHEDIFNTMHKI